MARKTKTGAPTVVIRREEIIEAGHHGGAWKVAYADFVTAMMAFFLLMWLINATTDKQRRGIADYFSPAGTHTRAQSGSGKPFGGLTPYEHGAQVSDLGSVSLTDQTAFPDARAEQTDDDDPPVGTPGSGAAAKVAGQAVATPPESDPDAIPINGDNHLDGNSGRGTATTDDGEAGDVATRLAQSGGGSGGGSGAGARDPAASSRGGEAAASSRDEDAALRRTARALRRSVSSDPALADAAGQFSVEVTPDGLRIQIMDAEGKPMFDDGSAVPNARARLLLERVAPVLAPLREDVTITGHTSSSPCKGGCLSNWALSAARADATRMVLDAAGLPDARVAGVSGVSDREPMVPGQAGSPANRRVVIVVHRTHPLAPDASPAATVADAPPVAVFPPGVASARSSALPASVSPAPLPPGSAPIAAVPVVAAPVSRPHPSPPAVASVTSR